MLGEAGHGNSRKRGVGKAREGLRKGGGDCEKRCREGRERSKQGGKAKR